MIEIKHLQADLRTVSLAPMEGVVDPVIRALYSKIGGFDHFVTEFIRVSEHLLPASLFYRFSPELHKGGVTEEGHPVFVQLLGGRPQLMGENAALAVQLGAPGIDLNFGCPAKTVNRNDGGATLLKNPHRLFDVITAVKKAVNDKVPVTAKVRLGFEDKSLCEEIALAVADARASSLTVHARTKKEGYKPPAHWQFIAKMREAVKGRVLVIANGDIWSLQDYQRCLQVTGCEKVAVGRGAIAKPDLAKQIQAYNKQQDQKPYTWQEVHHPWLGEFIEKSLKVNEPFAIRRTKQWVKLLGREYPEAVGQFEAIKRCQSLDEIKTGLKISQQL